ncbi:hypothetical protein EGR_03313 [Echinococcus granulosus]|uniref:Uncharacterized protein n=1 Tax=Echinococcus granulosus TaxID=6210 RepID=W6UTR4_ECHGR|nr:hypothetical protein EGR_03313 [Echinococcus granulosus]EUB61767.1 hypothetical protein EGR_03313 [Echinococcus granulosus]
MFDNADNGENKITQILSFSVKHPKCGTTKVMEEQKGEETDSSSGGRAAERTEVCVAASLTGKGCHHDGTASRIAGPDPVNLKHGVVEEAVNRPQRSPCPLSLLYSDHHDQGKTVGRMLALKQGELIFPFNTIGGLCLLRQIHQFDICASGIVAVRRFFAAQGSSVSYGALIS